MRTGHRNPSLFHFVVWITCLLGFVTMSDANYRSSHGYMGGVMPAWQQDIIGGTAPAPYVYRQGVPRLRQAFMHVLLPGHAALLVDLLFAFVAAGAGVRLAAFALGRDLAPLGAIIGTFACIAVYPNDKPESVAAVAVTSLIAALIVAGPHVLAGLIAVCASLIRPEIPILVGAAMMTAALRIWQPNELTHRQAAAPIWSWAGVTLAGLLYLVLARLWLWPNAGYPPGVSALMIVRNLMNPVAWPGLVLGFLLATAGLVWATRGVCTPASSSRGDERLAMTGLGLYVLLQVVASLALGAGNEVRLFMPVVPIVFLLGAGRWSLASKASIR